MMPSGHMQVVMEQWGSKLVEDNSIPGYPQMRFVENWYPTDYTGETAFSPTQLGTNWSGTLPAPHPEVYIRLRCKNKIMD
jgi:hypothetical protein